MIRVDVARLVVNEQSGEHLLTLQERGGPRSLSILIGAFEVAAIEEALEDQPAPRPLTHELILNTLTVLESELRYVIIDEVVGEVFHAKLVIGGALGEQNVDARPSDAVAVALRGDVTIFASERVLRVAGEG
jgi:bifunctional DNase/RNase